MKNIIYIANVALVFLLLLIGVKGNDKNAGIAGLGIIALFCINLLLAVITQIFEKPVYPSYYISAIGLLVTVVLVGIVLVYLQI